MKMPMLRYELKYILSDLSSAQYLSGTYLMVIVPKSGSPVFGQTEVNSGSIYGYFIISELIVKFIYFRKFYIQSGFCV